MSYGGHVQIVYIEDRISCQEKFSRPKQSSFWYLEQHISFNTQSTNNEKLLFNKSGFDRSSSGSRTPLEPKHDMNLDLYVISFKEIAALDDYRNHISPSHINEVIQELNSFLKFFSICRPFWRTIFYGLPNTQLLQTNPSLLPVRPKLSLVLMKLSPAAFTRLRCKTGSQFSPTVTISFANLSNFPF